MKIIKLPIEKLTNLQLMIFLLQLSHKNWDTVSGGKYVNLTFNSFLNSFLRIFHSSFPTIQRVGIKSKVASITWITKGIRISCKHKRELYLLSKKE
jgi:hypothetical protein